VELPVPRVFLISQPKTIFDNRKEEREREREEGEKGQAENPNPAHLDNISKPRFICAVNQQTRTHSTKETGKRNTGSKRKREREGETLKNRSQVLPSEKKKQQQREQKKKRAKRT